MQSYQSILNDFITYWTAPTAQRNATALSDFYHPDIVFKDPIGEKHGLSTLAAYFKDITQNMDSCDIEVTATYCIESTAFIVWKITYTHPRLNQKQKIVFEGISQLNFAMERIIYHQDYFDLGAMIYEHLPVFGKLIRYFKQRLSS